MRARWLMELAAAGEVASLAESLGISRLLASALVRRGYSNVQAAQGFLNPRLQGLGDPFEIPDMGKAVDRLRRARAAGERVLVFGDYDVDGITASAILVEVLGSLGWKVACYLPDRFTEGYGLSRSAVQRGLSESAASLLVAVDCGSSSGEVIDELARAGTEVVVLDHHQLAEPLPAPAALVNPRRWGSGGSHPARELCSAGLAFKLAHALVKAGRQRGEAAEGELDVRGWLDLVALGTVADLVPLTGENRILVSAGLRGLAGTDRPGLRALRSVAGVSGAVGVYEAGFQLAPRLNAAGRLETAQDSLKLLLASDPTEAGVLAGRLDRRNRERQDLERRVAEQALARVRERFDPVRDRVIVEGDSEWHIGVVGIVASRLVKAFYRPTMVLGGDGVTWRGSGRSIEGFDLAAALRDCGDLLIRHGGHAMAAGVSVDPAAVPALRDRLNDLARARMGPDVWQPTLRLEGEPGLEELTVETVRELGRLEPVGQGNPPVQLRFRGVRVAGPVRRLGQDGRHAKFSVEQRGSRLDVVWWGGGQETQPSGNIDLAAVPELNTYQGRERVQLRLLDWCSAQAG